MAVRWAVLIAAVMFSAAWFFTLLIGRAGQ